MSHMGSAVNPRLLGIFRLAPFRFSTDRTAYHGLLLADSTIPHRRTDVQDYRMAEAALAKQKMYAALLKNPYGFPLLIPCQEIDVGDVGYFVGAHFAKIFNVFSLTTEVRSINPVLCM